MEDTEHWYLCECDNFDCDKKVKISMSEMAARIQYRDLYIIVDGCNIGPGPNDELVSNGNGYKTYREKQ